MKVRLLVRPVLTASVTLVLVVGCGQRDSATEASRAGSGSGAAWSQGGRAAGERQPSSFGAQMLDNLLTTPQAPRPSTMGVELQELELAGEIELSGDRVQRSYRVRLVNRGDAWAGLEARLSTSDPRLEIVDGVLRIGELAAGGSAIPHDTIVVRHTGDFEVDPATLRMELREVDAGTGAGGTLLPGKPGAPALSALRDFSDSGNGGSSPAALTIDAVLSGPATIGDVNDALRRAEVRIVDMRPGNRLLRLRMVWTGDRLAAQRRIEMLRTSPAFETVRPIAAGGAGTLPGTDGLTLPDPVPDPEPEFNDHRDI